MMLRRLSLAFAATAAIAAPASAQESGFRSVELAPSAGYMFFGDYLEGPLGTSLRAANGALYGVQLSVNLSSALGFYGNVGYASSDLQVGLPILGGLSVGSTDVYMYDGGVELRLPFSNAASPFLQVGAGAMRHEIHNGLVRIDATNTVFNGGVGLDVQLTPSIGLRLMAKDYVGRFDFEEATMFDLRGRTAHNLAVTAGLRVGF